MKSTLHILSVFTVLLLVVGLASAALTVSPSNINLQRGNDNSTFSVTNTDSSAVNVLFSQLSITDEKNTAILFNINGNSTLPASGSQSFTLLPVSPIDYSLSNFNLAKTYPAQFTVSDSLNPNVNKTISVVLKSDYCEAGNKGGLDITDIEFTNNGPWGEDDEWYPTEEIEVQVDVENNGNDDLDDVIVSWGLYNKKTGKFIVDDETDSVNIDEGDEESYTFTFDIDPDEIDESDSEGDFVFFAKAFSDDLGENDECNSEFDDNIKILRDNHFVAITNVEMPETAQCGQNVEITADVWNIGDSDEDDVYVTLVSTELGINERIDVGNLDIFEDSSISFNFVVPADKKDGSYRITLSVYDEDSDLFENDNDDESVSNQLLALSGCTPTNKVSINALLDSDAVAGEEMIIKATLNNAGSARADYRITINGYDSWASLGSISPAALSLDAGRNGDVFIKLTPNDDVSGNQEFVIQVVSEGIVNEQRVSVPIEAAEVTSGTGGITGGAISDLFSGEGNWFIWVIALINIVLIVLIIIVAIRLARR